MRLIVKLLDNEHFLVLLIIPLFWGLLLHFRPHPTSYWLELWWLLPISFLIALTVNTAGISGAALFVPFFILVFPLFGHPLAPGESVKIGLITESFGLSSSALAFLRYGLVDKKLGFYTVFGATPFVVAGAYLSFYIPKVFFNFIIATALLISVYLLLHKERSEAKIEGIENRQIGSHHPHHDTNVTLVDREGKEYRYCRCGYRRRFLGYGAGGVFQGMAGFGIGELGIVSMLVTDIPIRVAIGTSHIIVASTAAIASLTHLTQSAARSMPTPWNILFMTVPAVILGGQTAPYVATKLRAQTLEYAVSALFLIIAITLIYMGL